MRVQHINLARGWRGGERQTLLLMEGLRDLGIESTLVARADEPLSERASAAGFQVYAIRKPFFLHGRSLRDADIVHAHDSHGLQLAAIWKRFHRRPLIVTRRVNFVPSRSWMTRWKYRQADRIVAISSRVRDVLVEWGMPVGILDLVYSSIEPIDRSDPETVARLRQRFAGKRVVGCVAALVESKDISTLLRAMARVSAVRPDATLVVLGDGPLRSELERQAADLDLANVSFEGFQEDPFSYYRIFDVVALTSIEEGLGTSVLDAFLYGAPVVATAAGGIPELFGDDNAGVMCPIGDDSAIAQGILSILDDDAKRTTFVKIAHARLLANFTASQMAAKYAAIYRKACGQ